MTIRPFKSILKTSVSHSLCAVALVATLALTGCAKDPTQTGSINRKGHKTLEQMDVGELNNAIAYLSKLYTKKPKDKRVGVDYATALRMAGRDEQALSVMQQTVINHPTDNQVLSAYGKALASNGNLTKALEVIHRAQRPDNPDWKLLSAEGAILDQLDRPQEARAYYEKALLIKQMSPQSFPTWVCRTCLRESFLRQKNT